ncbi:Tenascin, partial [Tetrabaena socialis]
CKDRGVCRQDGEGGAAKCVCHPGFQGDDCSQPAPSALCPNDCAGRGKCVGGFCQCEPPYWGIGCARAKAFEPVQGSVHHPYYPSLKVYMYDIPMSVVGPQPFDDGDADVFVIYQAFQRFMEMFLRDTSGVRTENPYEANLFYIPTFAFYATCGFWKATGRGEKRGRQWDLPDMLAANLGDPTAAVVRAVDWASSKFPFFARSKGKDHFVVLTSDRGACYLQPAPQTENLIRLVHFGLERFNISDMGPLVQNKEYGCFKSGRDVVMAPFFKPKDVVIREVHAQLEQAGGPEALLAKKNVLFFFSGDVSRSWLPPTTVFATPTTDDDSNSAPASWEAMVEGRSNRRTWNARLPCPSHCAVPQ